MHPRRGAAIHPRSSTAPCVVAYLTCTRRAKELPNDIPGVGTQSKCSATWPIRGAEINHAVVIHNGSLQRTNGGFLKMFLPDQGAAFLVQCDHLIAGQGGINLVAANCNATMKLGPRARLVFPNCLACLTVHRKNIPLRCLDIENAANRYCSGLLIQFLRTTLKIVVPGRTEIGNIAAIDLGQ